MKYAAWVVRITALILFFYLVLNGKMFVWLGIFAISLLAALLFGRIYCGYICPMNTVMIVADKFSKKSNLQARSIPAWLSSNKLPWISLAVSVVLMIAAKRALKIDMPILLVWLLLSVLVTLRWPAYVFHNNICPFGALQKVFGTRAQSGHRVDASRCIGCKLCETVCPSAAVAVKQSDKKAHIETALCHQCGECAQICPKQAIRYQKNH